MSVAREGNESGCDCSGKREGIGRVGEVNEIEKIKIKEE